MSLVSSKLGQVLQRFDREIFTGNGYHTCRFSASLKCISQNRTPVTMTLITLIMEQNGPGAGGWVLGFSRGHNAAREVYK